ncbi:M48 family metalloprotease [Flavobacterium hauense]
MKTIGISKEFKRSAQKAILSIVLFIFTYISLVVLAVGLTIACGYGGVMLIALRPSFATLMLGLGCISIGLLILFFMVKFVFSKNKTDRSQLIEIKQQDEPQLFAFIKEIVDETGTDFPKKIYISSEVNASVFYDSSFWSMFLPVKKNLHLGVGLMNSVTVDEFKGIVAHEFGHFSQRSMKVGSYVYNVNYILHNMLYDNASYDTIISKWANISSYFSFAALIGIRIIDGIQWVLRKVYEVVNINYLALSREMEFHADEVAANVAGSQALATSLVRLDLAGHAYNHTLEFYGQKIADNKKPDNIFPQMSHVMIHWANEFKLPTVNGLPQATLDSKTRFNKSKLSFGDQWSSHPSDKDRINRLESLNIPIKNTDTNIATTLFKNNQETQKTVTAKLFSEVNYAGIILPHTINEFQPEFQETINKSSFHKKYNNYFDDQMLGKINFDDLTDSTFSEEELFNDKSVDLVYQSIGYKNDFETLNQIASGTFKVKSFDYSNIRYKASDAANLAGNVEEQLIEINQNIEENNKKIVTHYYNMAKKNGQLDLYINKFNQYQSFESDFEKKAEILKTMYDITSFTQQTCSFDKIELGMKKVYRKEEEFRIVIKELLENKKINEIITEECLDIFTRYTSENLVYFTGEQYNEGALSLMFGSMNHYNGVINNSLFMYKKDFLDFQATLSTTTVATASFSHNNSILN